MALNGSVNFGDSFKTAIERAVLEETGDVPSSYALTALSEARGLADARVNRKTGLYHESFEIEQKDQNTVTLRNTAPHASIVEDGKNEHQITGNPYLAFDPPASETGIQIYGPGLTVTSPAQEGKHVLRDAANNAIEQLRR